MKALLATLALAFGLMVPPAYAGNVDLMWNPGAGAESTDIEQSLDGGATWTFVKNVKHASPDCVGAALSCMNRYLAPSTGLVLFRFVQINAVGKTIRADAGPWHNEKWKLPDPATAVGSR